MFSPCAIINPSGLQINSISLRINSTSSYNNQYDKIRSNISVANAKNTRFVWKVMAVKLPAGTLGVPLARPPWFVPALVPPGLIPRKEKIYKK